MSDSCHLSCGAGSHSQRVTRLKSEPFAKARMHDGCTFLMMECRANTPLGRALCGEVDIRCMSTATLEELDGLELEGGWRVNVLSTPHRSMRASDLKHIKRELEHSFGADAGMDACPRGGYTIALSAPDRTEYASFVAFRAFAAVNHTHGARMMFVYIDHIVTNENHRRQQLGTHMIDLIRRACVPVCQLYSIPAMHVVAQASFAALPFYSNFMSSCTDACLVMLKLVQLSGSQDDGAPNRRTGRFKMKLFADVIDMLMEVPVP